ncbi:hypothetical protein BGX27_005330 [Mortierella sp. AM989]|nr:hypothetical protein BGX27_005330 [Mortierella sp. AM989]
MVKFTSLLLASVAILAVSTKAQVSTEPRAMGIDQLESNIDSLLVDPTPFEEEQNMVILPYSGAHRTLERRAAAPKPKKPTVKLTKEQQVILDTHNKYRALHQAPPLKWNTKAANFGNKWIQNHRCKLTHSSGPYGENLAFGYKNFKAAINGWYGEVKDYKYNNPGFSGATGHFTQVVWKGTKSVGCAKVLCPGSNRYTYVCEYDGPGNYRGEFPKNVLPPKKK